MAEIRHEVCIESVGLIGLLSRLSMIVRNLLKIVCVLSLLGALWLNPSIAAASAPSAEQPASLEERFEARWDELVSAMEDYADLIENFEHRVGSFERNMMILEANKARILLQGHGIAALRAELSEAHALGVQLSAEEQSLRRERSELESLREALARDIDRDILRLSGLSAEAERLWMRRLRTLRAALPSPPQTSVEELLAVPLYTPEQVQAAMDELRDLEGAVQRSLEAMEEEIRQVRMREELEARRASWAWEEAHSAASGRRRGGRGGRRQSDDSASGRDNQAAGGSSPNAPPSDNGAVSGDDDNVEMDFAEPESMPSDDEPPESDSDFSAGADDADWGGDSDWAGDPEVGTLPSLPTIGPAQPGIFTPQLGTGVEPQFSERYQGDEVQESLSRGDDRRTPRRRGSRRQQLERQRDELRGELERVRSEYERLQVIGDSLD